VGRSAADVKTQRKLHSPKFDETSSFDQMMAIAESAILRRALDNAEGAYARRRARWRCGSHAEAPLKMLDLHHPTMFRCAGRSARAAHDATRNRRVLDCAIATALPQRVGLT